MFELPRPSLTTVGLFSSFPFVEPLAELPASDPRFDLVDPTLFLGLSLSSSESEAPGGLHVFYLYAYSS